MNILPRVLFNTTTSHKDSFVQKESLQDVVKALNKCAPLSLRCENIRQDDDIIKTLYNINIYLSHLNIEEKEGKKDFSVNTIKLIVLAYKAAKLLKGITCLKSKNFVRLSGLDFQDGKIKSITGAKLTKVNGVLKKETLFSRLFKEWMLVINESSNNSQYNLNLVMKDTNLKFDFINYKNELIATNRNSLDDSKRLDTYFDKEKKDIRDIKEAKDVKEKEPLSSELSLSFKRAIQIGLTEIAKLKSSERVNTFQLNLEEIQRIKNLLCLQITDYLDYSLDQIATIAKNIIKKQELVLEEPFLQDQQENEDSQHILASQELTTSDIKIHIDEDEVEDQDEDDEFKLGNDLGGISRSLSKSSRDENTSLESWFSITEIHTDILSNPVNDEIRLAQQVSHTSGNSILGEKERLFSINEDPLPKWPFSPIPTRIVEYDELSKADTEIGAEDIFEDIEGAGFKEIRTENEQIIEVEANLEKIEDGVSLEDVAPVFNPDVNRLEEESKDVKTEIYKFGQDTLTIAFLSDALSKFNHQVSSELIDEKESIDGLSHQSNSLEEDNVFEVSSESLSLIQRVQRYENATKPSKKRSKDAISLKDISVSELTNSYEESISQSRDCSENISWNAFVSREKVKIEILWKNSFQKPIKAIPLNPSLISKLSEFVSKKELLKHIGLKRISSTSDAYSFEINLKEN